MSNESAWAFGSYVLDLAARRLSRGGTDIPLTPKALETLKVLIERRGEAVSRQELLDTVWPHASVEENNLAQNISLLRKIFGTECYIVTVSKYGYRFSGHVTAYEGHKMTRLPSTQYARSGNINIAWQVLGEGPVDLVFVMGWVSHLEYFWTEPAFARFLRRLSGFCRLILFDKRGTGLSDRVPEDELPTLEQRMEDLRTVMNAAGSTRAVICGVSEGGPMSALFAATYPEVTSGLIMIGTYARRLASPDYPWGVTVEQREHFLWQIENEWGGPVGLEERAPSMAAAPPFRDWWAAYLRMSASPGAALAMTRMNAQIDVRPILPTVRVPTLVLHRSGDTCLKVEEGRYVASLIPGARFVELPGVDHLPFVGDQDSILGEIEAFVSGMRHQPDSERVLATVLSINTAGSGAPEWRTLLRRDVEWYGGRDMQDTRAGNVALFDGPARAIRCGLSLVQRAAHAELPIHVGVHTGECDCLSTGQAGGLAVDISSRLSELAAAGEIWVSSTVRDLSAGSQLRFDPRGNVTFRSDLGAWPVFCAVQRNSMAATSPEVPYVAFTARR